MPSEGKRTQAQHKKEDSILVFLAFFLILFLLSSGFFFMAYWEKNASGSTFDVKPEYKYENGTYAVTQEATIVIDNYYPFLSRMFEPFIEKITYYDGNETTVEVDPSPTSFIKENITINQITWKITSLDGSEEPPLTLINPGSLYDFKTAGMSKNTINISWTYEKVENQTSSYVRYRLGYNTIKNSTLGISESFNFFFGLYTLNTDWQKLVYGILFFSSSAFAGFLFTWLLLFGRTDYKKAFRYLKKFHFDQPQSEGNIDQLSNQLKILKHFPHLLRSAWRFILGLSLLIFKVHIANCCKYHRDKCNLECKEKFEDVFSKNTEITESKVIDLLPEKQTILILIGLLTTFGVSFSFNLGALTPFILSLVLFYAFFNIGSTFYLFGKTRDLFWPSLFFTVTVLAVLTPTIISILRIAMR